MSGLGDSFTCANCHGTFEKNRSDEEAAEELAANFDGEFTTEDCDVICDDCYRKFMGWAAAEGGILSPASPYLIGQDGPELVIPKPK